jgi:hypothetical protein
MSSRKPRTIRLGTTTYLWRVHHRHTPLEDGKRACSEVFTAFHEAHPRKPVRIVFPETAEHGPGYPSQSGVVVDYQRPQEHLNLNRPLFPRLLITLAIRSGWAPAALKRELSIENGYHLLRNHPDELAATLASDAQPKSHSW